MDVPLTTSGKPCKLCKAGKKCRHHESLPKKFIYPSPVKMETLQDLDIASLQFVLLQLDLDDLKNVCGLYDRARVLCGQPKFRKDYFVKYLQTHLGMTAANAKKMYKNNPNHPLFQPFV